MRLIKSLIAAVAIISSSLMVPAQADTLNEIQERGVIRVGVRADARPWAFLDSQGRAQGMEIDLGKELARRLKVSFEPVIVSPANRIQFLEQGRVDMLLATLSDTEARRKIVTMIEPHYYADGMNVMARKEVGIKKWSDLEGKKVCAVQGASYNRPVAQKYRADVVAFTGEAEALSALRGNVCIAFVYADTIIAAKLLDKQDWEDYEMPLSSLNSTPWAAAIRLNEQGGSFSQQLSAIFTDMHVTGYFLDREKAWGLPISQFLLDSHQKAMIQNK